MTRSTLRAVAVGFGLMILGIVVGALGSTATFYLTADAGIAGSEHGQWIVRYGLQYGFLVLAVTYMLYCGSVDRFVRISRPDLEGIAWMVFAPVALIGSSVVFDPVLASFGIESATSDLGPDPTATVSQFAVFFVAAWLVAAPAEELLFRGVIQGRLREAMNATGAVLVAAIIFSLMHVVFGVLEGHPVAGIASWGIETLIGGLVFGAAYERTDNLVVPSVIHATMWTIPYFFL